MIRSGTFLLVLLSIWGITVNAQSQRFTYEYAFKPDSLNREHVVSELMNLDVSPEGSVFYSSLLLDRDSLFQSQIEQGKKSGNIVLDARKLNRSRVSFAVTKNYREASTAMHTRVNAINLKVKDDRPLEWTVLADTKKMQGFTVQKASATFAGRHWIAWFTDEIQLQDGPYKFRNLPGLILQIEDAQADHVFTLVAIKKQFSRTYVNKTLSKEIAVTPQKFNELWNAYINDPAKNIKLIHGSSAMAETLFYDSNTGNPLTKQDLIRNKERGMERYLEQHNNFLEPDLYKRAH